MKITIPSDILRNCEDYARANPNEEICGLFEGSFNEDGSAEVLAFHPIDNVAVDKIALFVMDPSQQIKTFNNSFVNKNFIVGCFHSHPYNLGIPSYTDRMNISLDYFWVIYGGKDKLSRAWFPVLETKTFLESEIIS